MRIKKAGLLAVILIAQLMTVPASASTPVNVIKIYDGDTVTLSDGTRVRLVQIDAPELASNECYANESRAALVSLLSGKRVRFAYDKSLDQIDKYGRKLGYLFVGKTNINVKMIRLGAAAPYFYGGDKGKYAQKMLDAVEGARKAQKGLWEKCPGTKLSVYSSLDTYSKALPQSASSCDPNYAGCVPVFPPDLDCSDIRKLGLAPVQVIGVDVHRLDNDGDGSGCE